MQFSHIKKHHIPKKASFSPAHAGVVRFCKENSKNTHKNKNRSYSQERHAKPHPHAGVVVYTNPRGIL